MMKNAYIQCLDLTSVLRWQRRRRPMCVIERRRWRRRPACTRSRVAVAVKEAGSSGG
jgi:hypothetical protein